MHLGVIVTNTDRSAFAARHPRDGEKFARLVAGVRPGWRTTAFDAVAGELPPTLEGIDGLIITGSPASVHDPDPWVGGVLAFVRAAHARRLRMFGACFGHQAIALALGGRVGRNPAGWVLGKVAARFEARPLTIAAAHREQVTALPPDARPVGSGPGCPLAAFAIGDGVLTTQYHPEMEDGFLAALVEELSATLPADVIASARASLALPTDDLAPRIAAFFEADAA